MTDINNTASLPTYSELPFVGITPSQDAGSARFDFWAPSIGTDYSADCAQGIEYAKRFLAYNSSQGRDSVPILPKICAAMPTGGEMTGVEIGFLTALEEALR